jgi:hypothetical protein
MGYCGVKRNPLIAARVDPADLDAIDRLCGRQGTTRSEVVRRAIIQALRAGSPAPTRGERAHAAGMTPAQRVRFAALRAGRAGNDRTAALAEAIGDPGASAELLEAVIASLPREAAIPVLRRVLAALGIDTPKEPSPNA